MGFLHNVKSLLGAAVVLWLLITQSIFIIEGPGFFDVQLIEQWEAVGDPQPELETCGVQALGPANIGVHLCGIFQFAR